MTFLLDAVLQGAAGHIFHDDIMVIAHYTDIIDIDDIGMRQLCCSLRLPMKLLNKLRIPLKLFMEDLDRYCAIKQYISCLIHVSHTAAANKFLQFVSIVQDTLVH